MQRFSGQTVIVTGGTRGIGRAIAEEFLKEGAMVIATYAGNEMAAKTFVDENQGYKDKIDIQKFDVSHEKSVMDFYDYIDAHYSSIEVLVNNSGIRQDALTAIMKNDQWQRVMDVNLGGTFLMSKEAVTRMMSNKYGRIINISSIGGSLGLAGQANYAASKAGQVAFAKTLSKEVGKKGITVNNVCPGFIETELLSDLPPEQVKEYKKTVPMKRFGKGTEVASAVLFLASKEASYITGTSLEVTGGL